MKASEAKMLEFLKKSPQFVIPIYQRTYSWTEREAWIPKVGLTKEELHLYKKKMALECERFEYLLTGTDRE